MSNSIFLFILGLTMGILLSMTLVSRYQVPQLQSTTEVATSPTASVEADKILSNSTDNTGQRAKILVSQTKLSASAKQEKKTGKEPYSA